MEKLDKYALDDIAMVDDLKISPFRTDGRTYGTPTWIWSVVVGNELYVRAYSGIVSSWYQAALSQKAGRIYVAGKIYDVQFGAAEADMKEYIDAAYRWKYAGSPYLNAMTNERSGAATVKITQAGHP